MHIRKKITFSFLSFTLKYQLYSIRFINYLMKTKQLTLALTLLVVICFGEDSSSDSEEFNLKGSSGNYFQEKYGA